MHYETEAERNSPQAYAAVLDLIRQADTLPIERAWLAEHHLSPSRGRLPAPLLMAVAAARETRRIGVGPGVIVLPLRHPLDVAEQIAVTDLLTEGRLAVGLGSGGNPEESAAFGVPLAERSDRFAEGLEIVMRALGGEPFAYSGAYYTIPEVTLVPRPLQRVGDMVWVAAGSQASADLAGRSGGHLLLARGVAADELVRQIEAYRRGRAEAQLDVTTAHIQVTRGLYVAETEEEAWRDSAESIRRHYARLARYGGEAVDVRTMAARSDFIVGTPEQCAEGIHTLHARIPVTHLALDIALIGMPHARVARSLDLFGRAVAPRLGA